MSYPTPATAKERHAEVRRIADALGTKSWARVLGAMGHPSYGEEHAHVVLTQWIRTGLNLHALTYGAGRENRRAIEGGTL